jgi:hypothetical protein
MRIEVNEQEAELINYFRQISLFNRERIFSLARNAHQDYLRAQKVQQCANGGQR